MTLRVEPLTTAGLVRAVQILATRDQNLQSLVNLNGIPPLWARRPGFATLVWIILGQQVSLSSAAAACRRLTRGVGRITPGNVHACSLPALQRLGLTRQKARSCRDLAAAVIEVRLDLRGLDVADPDHVREQLTAVMGIGPWTADIYLLMALRHPDIWPRGDLALYESMRAFTGTRRTAAQLDRHANAWRPYRSVAARILWHGYLAERRRASRQAMPKGADKWSCKPDRPG